ncbi:MAG: dockerin type I repeat-containing protein [Prevotella sp.]|nr:dockerin type I repeat-containing protein [Prevotella sp.]
MKRTIKAMMLFLAIMTTASAWAGNKPKFCLDFCEGGLNNILITGWAFDPDVPAASIEIHVYIYTDASCSKQYEYTAVSIGAADVPRPDVNTAYNITGSHGFQTFIPIDDVGTYYVRVYALDGSGDNTNPLMNNPYTAVTVTTHEGNGTYSNPFTIGSKEDWDLFARLTTNPGTAFYYGLGNYKMTADVGTANAPVTSMWGTAAYPFSGEFDGDGKTLLVNIVTDGEQAAPFRVVNGATIKNLNVGGLVAVNTDAHNNHAGGLVGYCKDGNTLVDGCNVATRVEAKMYCGGIVGHGGGTGLTIRNSIFSGSIAGFTKCAAGLVGWCDWLSMNLINCLTTGTFESGGGFYHPIALTNNSGKAHADAEGVYYSNDIIPTAQTNLVQGGLGHALNKTRVPGEWTTYVIAVDGSTWYAAGSDGFVAVDDGGKDFDNWSNSPESPIGPGEPVTLTYSGVYDVNNISAVKQWYGDLSDLNGNVTVTDGMVLSGKLDKIVKVSIPDGATVTLRDVDIKGGHNDKYVWGGINCEGDATIILSGTNYVKGFNFSYPAIYIPEGKTLTIRGNGSLEAHSNGNGAAIGGGEGVNCGNIVIESGTIKAYAGYKAAAIGGGSASKCGNITINADVNIVTAYRSTNSTYSIGPGNNGTCGTITIGDKKYDPLAQSVSIPGLATPSPAAAFTSDNYIPLPVEVFPGEADGTWNFTMPYSTVVVNAEYVPAGFVTFAEGTKDVEHWSVTPDNPVPYGSNATLTYTGPKVVKSVTATREWDGNLATLNANATATNGMVLTGRLGANVKVSIADGATVKLQDVTIDGVNWAICPWAGITCEGDATIILSGTNYVKGFHSYYPGIFVPRGKTLTIRGNGSLEARSNEVGAGIGAGMTISCGNIVIEGGTINAYGGGMAAGIGSCLGSDCGDITITDGVNSVTAHAGQSAPYSIGQGSNFYIPTSCGTITIGGTVTRPISDETYTYTGKGTSTSEMPAGVPTDAFTHVTFGVGAGEAEGTWAFIMPAADVVMNVEYENAGRVTFAEGTEDLEHWSITPANPVPFDSIATLTYSGTKVVKSVTAAKQWYGDLSTVNSDFTATNGMTLTGKLGSYTKVSIADGATVMLKDVTIDGVNWSICPWAGITCEGDATIILSGTNYVKGFSSTYSAIFVPEGKTLTIRGNGSLEATALVEPAIGGYNNTNCGNIVIEGGTIVANGGVYSPGIGCGRNSNCGNITITDGVNSVTSTKGQQSPYCIGTGRDNGTIGTITIGGNVTEGSISGNSYTYTGKGTSTSEMPAGVPANPVVYIPYGLTPGETDGTWTFTMPGDNVIVSVEYESSSCDVNGDGGVDVADIGFIIDVMAGVIEGDDNRKRADVNGDTGVDVADIATVIDYMANNSRRELRPADSE